MTEVINGPRSYYSVGLDFAWTPATTVTQSNGRGGTFTVPGAHSNTNLAFTTTSLLHSESYLYEGNLTFIEYKWHFGDGVIGYGSQVSHTYVLANPRAVCTLTVTDSLGNTHSVSHAMYLTTP